jgi:hypothetical protein
MATTSRKNIMTIAMGAMALITLATTVIIGKHYWDMLSGVFVVAILGLALPDWVAWWSTYLHAKATKDGNEDPAVAKTSLVVSFILSAVMILNAGAVLAVWWDSQEAAKTVEQTSKASTDLQHAKNAGTTEAIEARGRVIAQLKSQGLSERAIREYLKTESARDQTTSLTTVAASEPEPLVAVEESRVPEPVKNYMRFWVFIIPALAGLLGLFALIVSVHAPGGLEFSGGTTVKQSPAMSPAPATAKTPNTTISHNGNFTPPTNSNF